MAQIFPFQPYRYSAKAGPLENLVTQPYDKISPSMQSRYLGLSPYNLVRVILGERLPSDDAANNVYTRAARYFETWIESAILERETAPVLFAYFQKFTVAGSGQALERKGLIALSSVEDYSQRIVYRHEQTFTGPKKDRIELLRHTAAHCEQLFMLYADPQQSVDRILDEIGQGTPIAVVEDEYGTTHKLWRISDPALIETIQRLMSDKKLLIADGHHRYETALAFRDENPHLEDAKRVVMTFVNMHSPGLKILAGHRLVSNLVSFEPSRLLAAVPTLPLASLAELKAVFDQPEPDRLRIGIALGNQIHLLDRPRLPGELDVKVLHEQLLGQVLGISEEAVRDERHIQYIRGLDAALEKVQQGAAQIGFLLEPTTIQQVADVAFSGGVMPQKSTDFYPKLLSGLAIYKLER
jgi:uncharacterized protein (DUF1015 family)